jgi:superfamily II DNA/RNA helicase
MLRLARGLNLPSVDWTVQYDPPCEVADYDHRADRTARGGKAGHSLLFLLPSERLFLDVLEMKGLKGMTISSKKERSVLVVAMDKAARRVVREKPFVPRFSIV